MTFFSIPPRWGCVTLVLILTGLLTACTPREEIAAFRSDGCTLFPNRSLIDEGDWCDCCLQHDIAYWKGGTEADRLAADEALRLCVLDRTGDEILANLMFEGVRIGGNPFFPTWYRWGYGWSLDRGYKTLSPKEAEVADRKLATWFRENPDGPCGPKTE